MVKGLHYLKKSRRSFRIEVGCRFIGQHEFRSGCKRPGHCNPLLLPPGQLRGPAVDPVTQSYRVQQTYSPFVPLVPRPFLKCHDEFDILLCSQDRNKVIRLKNKPDVLKSEINKLR